MKEICQCNCSSPATAYRTPWCSMLRGGEPTEILHLWYKMELLRKEVRQRLAYLGSTQNYAGAPNVFDLVGATPTSDTPLPFQFNFSVSEIKNAVQKRTAYLGSTQNYAGAPNVFDLVGATPTSDTPLPFQFNLSIADIKEAVQKRTAYLGKLRRSEDAVHLLDLIAFTDDEEDLFVEFAKETMPEVWNTLSAPFVAIEKRAWWQEEDTATLSAGIVYQFDESYYITENDMQPLKTAVMEAIVMRIIWKWLTLSYPSEAASYDAMYQQSLATLTQRTNEFKARWVNVFVPYAKEAMAEVWNTLSAPFVAIEKRAWWQEEDTATLSAGIVYQFDESYYITENDMQPLKTAVMEAIVMRIIWKWLTLSYPSEAASYDAMYQQSLVTLTQRTNEFKARWVNVFVPYARAAMADVFEVLNTSMPKMEKAYFFREGKETVILPDVPDEGSLLHLSQLDADNVDEDGFVIVDTIPEDEDGYILISETGVDADGFIVPDEDSLLHLSQLDADNVDEDGFVIVDTIPEDEDGYILISETGVDADGFIAPDGDDDEHPTGLVIYFHAGDYVQYKGELYMAIADGSSIDFAGKLVPTEDYRDSVHYGLNWRCCGSNINAVEPLDTAIFEALVARIIYKWLCMSYPAETERYQAEWLEHLEAIRRRCNILNGPQIVNRIPRI